MRRRAIITSVAAGAAAVLLASAAVATAVTRGTDAAAPSATETVATARLTPTTPPSATPKAPEAASSATAAPAPTTAADPLAGGGAPVAPVDEPDPGTDAVPPPHCIDEQLALAYESRPEYSGMGRYGFALVFTNVSPTACSFDGWPGVIAVDAAGDRIGGPAFATGASSQLVVLEPGGAAESLALGAVTGVYDCVAVEAAGLRAFISSDGAGPGVALDRAFTVCDDDRSMFTVEALRPR